MYSEQLTRLFHEAAHAGGLEDATHYGEAGTPGHGPYICLSLRVEQGTVTASRFRTYGCPAAIACAEAVCRWSEGKPVEQLAGVGPADVTAWVEGVPEGKEHCPQLAAQALMAAGNGELCRTE